MPRNETIKYEVVKQDGIFELRKYDDILLASTKTNVQNRNESGFNNVFQFISGENSSNTKISMTTPVVTYQEEEILTTGFYVPSIYDGTTVPKPTSDKVFLNTIDQALFVVVTFNGAWVASNYEHYEKLLNDYIKDNNYIVTSNKYIFRYQAPYIPDHLKRNEIAFKIQDTILETK